MSRTRTCVGCRWTGPATYLLRVVAVDGGLQADPAASRPGRGAWVHPTAACVEAAGRRRAWARALRQPGPLDDAAVRAHLDARV